MMAEHARGDTIADHGACVTQATLRTRRDVLQAELLRAMQHVEQLRGAIACLDELLTVEVVAVEDGAG
jgi:hypothetical protein